MSDIANHDSRYSTPEEGSSSTRSTSYSEFCDDDVIRAAATDLTQPDGATSLDQFVVESSSSAPPPSSSSTVVGKRKSPDDSVLSDRPYASYKRRAISTGIPVDIDSLAPLESPSSSGATRTLCSTTPPLLDDTPDDSFKDRHHHHDAVGPEPYIIAHNTSVKQAMDARELPWGVQWEIARLISLGHCSWNDISMPALDVLRNEGLSPPDPDVPTSTPAVLNARAGPYIEELFRWNRHTFGSQRPTKEVLATSPWQELDKEDLAFKRYGPTGCLGSTPELGDFYGGKVSFCMRAQLEQGELRVTLERPVLGHSSRFTRCYGSSWLLKLRLPTDTLSKPDVLEKLRRFLTRPLVLNGRVFRFFNLNKNHGAYFMATNEWYKGGSLQRPSPLNDQGIYCSFLDFFRKHNDLEQNNKQTMAKWAARIPLGLSNSVPGMMLNPNQIRQEVDIVSSSCPADVKPPSEMVMTDGCGLINLQAMHMLHKKLGLWKEVPVAIQCRLAGAKGLVLLHPNKEENSWDYPCIWLRPSQIKIQLTESYLQNPAHRVIDTLRASHMRSPVQFSKEIIINLSENGVSPSIFIDLFYQSMENTISPLLHWDGQDAMAQLWAAVAREGNVMAARIALESAWTARARGVHLYLYDQDESSEGSEVDNSLPESVAWWGDDISGCPSSIEETVMTFLDTGFHPATNAMLAERLKIVANKAVKSCITKSRVMVPMSCSALIVPDPLGVLQDGEIHIKCSQRCLLRPDGQKSDRILGDVLVTRNPCKLPTDVQKVKAVFKPELDDYVNVIIFSIKGSRSLASMLGTGDYDGDRVDCIWQPNIVEQFSNADDKYMDPPTSLWDNFAIKNETVEEFLQRVPPTSPIDNQIKELQTVLMGALHDLHIVGTYSTMHDNAIYTLGYSHPTTILLAWMFCTVLDGAKTGKTVLPGRYKQDRDNKQYGTQFVPQWKKDREIETLQFDLRRGPLPPFVMDLLTEAMDRIGDEQRERIKDHFSALHKVKDKELVAPWQDAEARAQELLSRPEEHVRAVGQAQKDALEAIKKHVARVNDMWDEMMKAAQTQSRPGHNRRKSGSGSGGGGGGAAFTSRSIESRQDQLRRVSREFAGGPSAAETFAFGGEEVARLRASYVYLYDWTHASSFGGSRFPWSVAMRDLGVIKLQARKDFKPISQDFYEKMSMRKL